MRLSRNNRMAKMKKATNIATPIKGCRMRVQVALPNRLDIQYIEGWNSANPETVSKIKHKETGKNSQNNGQTKKGEKDPSQQTKTKRREHANQQRTKQKKTKNKKKKKTQAENKGDDQKKKGTRGGGAHI